MSEEERVSFLERFQNVMKDMNEQNISLMSQASVCVVCRLYSVLQLPEEAQLLLDANLDKIDAATLNDVIFGKTGIKESFVLIRLAWIKRGTKYTDKEALLDDINNSAYWYKNVRCNLNYLRACKFAV